jgi:hypothetical protein
MPLFLPGTQGGIFPCFLNSRFDFADLHLLKANEVGVQNKQDPEYKVISSSVPS